MNHFLHQTLVIYDGGRVAYVLVIPHHPILTLFVSRTLLTISMSANVAQCGGYHASPEGFLIEVWRTCYSGVPCYRSPIRLVVL